LKLFEKLKNKIDKIVLIFTLIVLLLSFYFVYSLKQSYSQKEAMHSLDNALFLTRNLLEEEEQHALSLSLLLSQDKTFLEAFNHNKRKKVFEIINEKIKSLKKLQGYKFEVQVHDKDLHTYVRSWDYSIKDVPLASFRQGLVRVKESKRPLVSIEVGKRLNIKAISPIIKDGVFCGSIEVIESFEHLQKKLAEHGYSLLILLNKKYLTIASSLKEHPIVLDRFILVNNSYDKHTLQSLQNSHINKLQSYGYFTQGSYAFAYFSIKNLSNESVGYFVIALQNSVPLMIKSYDESNQQESNNSSKVIIR
jgi:hypothetical protein